MISPCLPKMIFPLCLSKILHPISIKDYSPFVPINNTAPSFYQRRFFPYSQYCTPFLAKFFSLFKILHTVPIKDIFPIHNIAPRFYQRLFFPIHNTDTVPIKDDFRYSQYCTPFLANDFSLFRILHTVPIKDNFPYSQYCTPCLQYCKKILSKTIFPIHNTAQCFYQKRFSLFTILHAVSIKDHVAIVPIQNTAPRACSKLHWTWCLVTALHLMPGYSEDALEMLQQWVAVAVCEDGARKWN